MRNKRFMKSIIILLILSLTFMLFLTGCGEDEKSEPGRHESSENGEEKTKQPDPEPTDAPETDGLSGYIKSVQVASDDTGIYAVTLKLTDLIADEGSLEWVYYGSVGSPQENSVVNTLVIDYFKNADGTYELRTFFDGEVYQNLHNLTEFKFTNGFSANLRAKDITISYTPKGGQTEVIFHGESGNYISRHE